MRSLRLMTFVYLVLFIEFSKYGDTENLVLFLELTQYGDAEKSAVLSNFSKARTEI